MVTDASSLEYHAAQNTAANEGGLSLLQELRNFRSAQEKWNEKYERQNQENQLQIQESQLRIQSLEASRKSWLALRQRTLSTWVRNALKKESQARNEQIRSLNAGVVHYGDIRHDAMVLTDRFRPTSSEWAAFRTLYGMTVEEWKSLDDTKCDGSIRALDKAASLLLKRNTESLKEDDESQREKLVALLKEGRYEDAEEMSSTIEFGVDF